MGDQLTPKNPMEWPVTYEEVELANCLAFAAKSDEEKLNWLDEMFSMIGPFLEPSAKPQPNNWTKKG